METSKYLFKEKKIDIDSSGERTWYRQLLEFNMYKNIWNNISKKVKILYIHISIYSVLF